MPNSKRRVPKHTGPTPPQQELGGAINLDQMRVQMMGEMYQQAITEKNALQQHVQTLTGIVIGLLLQSEEVPVTIHKMTLEKIHHYTGIKVTENDLEGVDIVLAERIYEAEQDEEE